MKRHETSYTSLSGCLEAHFGDRRAKAPARKYHEPEQGFRTVLYKSLPLQLNHMRRRPGKFPTRLLFG
jgi:hypothetical protein